MSLKIRSKPKSPPTSPSIPHPGPQASRWGASITSGSEERLQTRAENAEQALKISKEIDSILQEGRKQLERRKKATKILLLGMSLKIVFSWIIGLTSPHLKVNLNQEK